MKSDPRFRSTVAFLATATLLGILAPPLAGQGEGGTSVQIDLPVDAISAHGLREILRIDARLPAQAHSLLSAFIAEDVGPRHRLDGEPLDLAAEGELDLGEIQAACLVPGDGSRRVLDLRRAAEPGMAASPTARCFDIVARDLPASVFRRPAVRIYGAGNVVFSSADYDRFSRQQLEDLQARTDVLRPFRPQTIDERVGAPVEMRVVVAEVRGDARAFLFGAR